MKKIYISGPITGLDYKKAKDNFEDAEKRITEQGHMAVNPMRLLPEGLAYESYMRADIMALMTCDSIYMLEGFRKSRGALAELCVARVIRLEVLYEEERQTEPKKMKTMINEFMERNPGAEKGRVIKELCPDDAGLCEDSINTFCSEGLCQKCWNREWKEEDNEKLMESIVQLCMWDCCL